ncbi:MAG TPA: hypothetical protein VNN79_04845, partial [Actinomycetota bacterium]|nr:hypothetical protein [Actinomycetota bacterium]
WVAGGTDGRITRIALPGYVAATEARTNTRTTGLARCAGRLWVATGDGDLVRVDLRTGRVRATHLGRYLTAVATDGRVVWAVDGAGGDATALDCATGRVLGRVPAGREATGVVATPGGAWVVDSGAGVVNELST